MEKNHRKEDWKNKHRFKTNTSSVSSIHTLRFGATLYVWSHHLCLESPLIFGATLYVWSHLLCLEPPFMFGATVYVWSHHLCLEPPFMFGVTLYVWSHPLCLEPPLRFGATVPPLQSAWEQKAEVVFEAKWTFTFDLYEGLVRKVSSLQAICSFIYHDFCYRHPFSQ